MQSIAYFWGGGCQYMGKPSEQRRQEIIDATLDLAASLGVKQVTTQAIADRVGIAQPTVFRHFKTRDAIFVAAISSIGEGLFRNLAAFFSGTGPADERLRQLVRAQLRFISQNRGLPRLLFSDRLHLESPLMKRAVQKIMNGYVQQVSRMIREGQAAGLMRESMDADESAWLVAALIQGLVMRWSIFDFDFDLVAQAEPLWEFIAAALLVERDG